MKRKWRVLFSLLSVFCISSYIEAQAQTSVIEGGTLLDGTGGAPLENAVIVIEGSRIKSVGVKGKINYPKNAKMINAAGKTILPGFIDCHIHLREWMLPLFLHYGVTTVYDTNNQTDWILLQKEALERGKLKGPRLFVTGMAVAGPGDPSNDTNFPVQTPEAARAFVNNLVGRGVDMIKTQESLTPELLKAVLDQAAKEGVPVVGHTANIRWATQLGYKFMEHTETLAHAILAEQYPEKLKEIEEEHLTFPEYFMDTKLFDPLIRLMVKQGVYINPTFTAYWRIASPRVNEWTDIAQAITKDPALGFVPPDIRQSWSRPQSARGGDAKRIEQLAEGLRKVQEFTREYAAAGGKVVAGSDSGYMPGLAMHFEMQSLVDAGVSPMKAILGATKWAAELAGKEKDLGTIEEGKLADITVVDGNPLADITMTRRISLVMKGGEILDLAYDPTFENPVPRPVNAQAKGPDMGPQLSAVAPRIARQGDDSVSLQVVGIKFRPKSVVRFDTTDLQTQFVSDSKLTAVIDRRSLQIPGTYAVTVVNPGSGGGTSNAIYFMVNFHY